MILPDGFALPPISYLLVLAFCVFVVVAMLVRSNPPVTARTVLAFTPWMGLGGGLHVLAIIEAEPTWITPFLGTPAVYASTAVLVGLVWITTLYTTPGSADESLGIIGLVGLIAVSMIVLWYGYSKGTLAPMWPVVGLLLAIGVTAALWSLIRIVGPDVVTVTSWAGVVVIFAHALDGISTAIGVDFLNAGERSPLPRAIMDVAGYLPTAELLGVGWLFAVVKLVIAVGIVWLFVPFVRETKRQGYLLLALLAAVGLGPGVHNLLLFMVTG